MSIFLISTLLANDDEMPTDLSSKTEKIENHEKSERNLCKYSSQFLSCFYSQEMLTLLMRKNFINQYSFYLKIFSGFPQFVDNFNLVNPTDFTVNSNSTTILPSFNFHKTSLNIEMNTSLANSSSTGRSSPTETVSENLWLEKVKVEKYFHLIENLSQSQENIEDIVKTIKVKRRNFAEYIKKLYLSDPAKFKLTNGGDGIVNPFRKQFKEERDKSMDKFCIEVNHNYQCKICNKVFPSKKHMQRHIRSHGVNFDWLCKYCFKPFIDSYDLKRHTRVHTGVQPYKCQSCTRKFSQRCSLESHQVKIHGVALNYLYKERRNKLYPCEICSYSTSCKATWLSHIIQEHPNSLYAKEEALKGKYN
uniref:Ovo n=1 Tax=Schmidtea mediterranea TaxID=79327 RepID=J7FM12_SCHMD|nr:ovo [Schmidtea mediterranea]